ncbi:hypothetical protein [Acinetobacter sp. Ac_5812]|uniref:hypothetical protein n=1 Tax=Acinetobacter sp. Ac_5812 TaxID=1848937 RepID=UPI00149075A7|nr:hypothetical protein [Acinetobacter sp. Ac_5812]NNP70449.1 hypothetical protein [Acinetobacter sp. Ac_5812]
MTNPSLQLYLRQKFEDLPEFKHLLELCEWDEAAGVYVNTSGSSEFEHYADGCNGGLTAFISQQHKIEELKSQLEKYEKPDHIETVNNVEVILERLTFHIFEEVLIWSNEHASKSFTRCVKKTVEEFKSGKASALRAEEKLEGCVVVPSQGLILTCEEILEVLEFGAPDLKIERTEYSEEQMGTEITIVHRDTGHSGAGIYAYCTECPEEGAIKLGVVEAARGGNHE